MGKRSILKTLSVITLGGLLLAGTALASGGGEAKTDQSALDGKHFHPKGKLPSKYTIEAQEKQRAMLPFDDKRDFDEQIKSGKVKLKGNREVYEQLKQMLVHFDMGFEIMPGTGAKDLTPEQNPFEQEEIPDTFGG